MVEVYDPGTHRPGSKLPGGKGLPVHNSDQYPGTDGSPFLLSFLSFQVEFIFSLVTWESEYYSVSFATRGRFAV